MRRVQLPLLRAAVVVGVAYALGVFGCGGGGEGVNTPPTASFTVVPTAGTTQTVFQVDASASTDRETAQAALEVRWDWDDDGVWDTQWSTTKTASHSYQTPGTKTIRLEVRDDGSDDGGGNGGCGSSGSSPRRSSTTVRTVEVQGQAPPDEALAGYWYPPRVGRTWSYQQTVTGGDDAPWLDTYTVFLERTNDITTFPGHTVWVMHWREHTEDDWGTYFVEVTPDQVRRLGDRWEDEYEIGIFDPPLVWQTGNAMVGNTWQFIMPRCDPGTATVTGVNQTVTVPAGTFQDCVKVEYSWAEEGEDDGRTWTETSHMTRWYARGVGLVKEHVLGRLYRASELEEEWDETKELVSYPQ